MPIPYFLPCAVRRRTASAGRHRCAAAARRLAAVLLGACLAATGTASLAQASGDEDDTTASRARAEPVPAHAADPATEPKTAEVPAPRSTAGRLFDNGVTVLEPGKTGTYRLEVRAPQPLRDLLTRHLDVARFRDQGDMSPVEIGRLLAATPAQVRGLLEPEGYFDPQIEVRRDEPAAAGGVPTLHVQVDPGPGARVGRVQLELQGAFATAMDAGDAALQRRWQRAKARWSLQSGEPFSQAAWTDAKNALLGSLRARGYPGATLAGSGAQVDTATGSVRLFVVVDSGPLFKIGDVRIEGLDKTPQSAALNLLPFQRGSVYSEQLLLDYQEALQKSGLYDGVAVELDPDPERADHATVVARLREAKRRITQASIGYSTNTGPRVGLQHTDHRAFGRDIVSVTNLKYGADEKLLSYDLLSYPMENGRRNLASVSYDDLNAGGSVTKTARARLGRRTDTQRLDRLYYLELNSTTLVTPNTRSTDRAVLGNYEWVRRDVNNLAFPTRGLILSAQGGGGYAVDDDHQRGPFVRLYLQANWYQPLPGGWLGQVRGEAAQVVKRSSLGVPDSLLFRAGGDVSVRGYAYQTLGPTRDGVTVGGPVLATGTLEAMHRLSESERWRDFFGAVFIDAGNVAARWSDLSPVYGYGVGVRWRSPIGPLKVDLAYGQAVKAVRLHLSVGSSF